MRDHLIRARKQAKKKVGNKETSVAHTKDTAYRYIH